MDHVQQILLQQLQGQVSGGQVSSGRNQRNSSYDSSNSDGSNSVSDLAQKARQWAEEQKRKQQQQIDTKQQTIANLDPGLQGWKNEHPSWFGPGSGPGGPVQIAPNFPAVAEFLPSRVQPHFPPVPMLQPKHSSHSSKKRKNRQNRQQNSSPAARRKVGTFPDFDINDTSKNLPKWMRDEISRIQHQKTHEENIEDEPAEANISELQKLVDAESDGESSEDDWKIEGRKLSEDLAKANESDPELSDAEEEAKSRLTQDAKDDIKNGILGSTLRGILLSVTDELTGKISRNAISKASAGQATKQSNSALGGLIGYGSDSDDSENENEEKEDEDGDSDWSCTSSDIRRKRKVFDRKQKRRLDKLRSARGSGDDESDESEAPSQSSSRYSSPGRRSPSSSKRKRSRSRNRSSGSTRSKSSKNSRSRNRTRSRSRSRRSSRSYRSYSREKQKKSRRRSRTSRNRSRSRS